MTLHPVGIPSLFESRVNEIAEKLTPLRSVDGSKTSLQMLTNAVMDGLSKFFAQHTETDPNGVQDRVNIALGSFFGSDLSRSHKPSEALVCVADPKDLAEFIVKSLRDKGFMDRDKPNRFNDY